MSLSWLHQRLVERGHPVSPAALSYWRSGRSQPERGTSRDALVEIERLLRVAPGAPLRQARAVAPPRAAPGREDVREMFAEHPGVQPALDALGFEGLYDELLEQLRHITVDVDAAGRDRRVPVRAMMQARRDGARRTPLIVTLDERRAGCRVRPDGRLRLGASATDLATGVFAAELLLDRPLAQGETASTSSRVELAEPRRRDVRSTTTPPGG